MRADRHPCRNVLLIAQTFSDKLSLIDEQIENENIENIFYMLNEKYLKIKECLARCGNQVNECKKEEVINILHFFLNTKNNLKRNGGD